MQGDFVVLASEPVCICGVDVAAPQQLRARNSKQKMSMAELRNIFSRQFTEYEVKQALSVGTLSGHPGILTSLFSFSLVAASAHASSLCMR